jgi:hypothetical protein
MANTTFHGSAAGDTGEVAELLLGIERDQAADAAYLDSLEEDDGEVEYPAWTEEPGLTWSTGSDELDPADRY